MSKKADKRIAFVRSALNSGLTSDARLANDWYISQKAERMEQDIAMELFAEWIACSHEEKAERCEALDTDGECEVSAAYHATRASEIRSAVKLFNTSYTTG